MSRAARAISRTLSAPVLGSSPVGVDAGVEPAGAKSELPRTWTTFTVPPADVMPVLAVVCRLSDGGALRYVAHAGTGTVWLAFDRPAPVTAWFPRLAALAQEYHGHAVLAAAPPEVKRTVDVWGPSPQALGLMQELKRQFDPHGTLNPGRFVAGI